MRSLEYQVLYKVSNAIIGFILIPGTRRYPESQGNGAKIRYFLTDYSYAIIKLGDPVIIKILDSANSYLAINSIIMGKAC